MPRLARLRILPWLALFEAVRTVQSHLVEHLSASDRRRVAEIVRRAKGDPRRVSARERAELRDVAGRLELARLGRDLLPAMARAVRGRGRR